MTPAVGASDDEVPFSTDIRVGDEVLHVAGTVPAGSVRVADLVPLFQRFTSAVTDAAVRRVEETGARISCRAGCGACCRQLVPVGEAEARRLAELVAGLPAERQAHVRARFAAALAALEPGGLLERLRHPEDIPAGGVRALGLEYFARGVACPFLESESCGIHPERPASCREYLVTSPAERCADPAPGRIQMVPLPGRVSHAIQRLGEGRAEGRWVPLVRALEWAAAQTPAPARPGPETLERFVGQLAGKP